MANDQLYSVLQAPNEYPVVRHAMLLVMLLTTEVRHAESARGCSLHAPECFARSAPLWCSEGASAELAQVGAARKDLHKPQYRRLNLAMLASACLMLGAHAVHAGIQTPVADILTILQTGLTGDSCDLMLQMQEQACHAMAHGLSPRT